MKTIYFVRHGESEANVALTHGHPHVPLTEKGRAQAEFIAERCAKLPIEAVLGSTMTRARDTAIAIAKKIGHTAEFSDLFVECGGPSKFQGLAYDDPEASEAYKTIRANFAPGYRFADEENFDDRKARAGKALEYLSQRKEDHIVVASHGVFLRILAAYALFGSALTAEECLACVGSMEVENTGLTILKYDEKKITSPWLLWVWNDHAHLG